MNKAQLMKRPSPASAGMIPSQFLHFTYENAKPRERGDDPPQTYTVSLVFDQAPRARG